MERRLCLCPLRVGLGKTAWFEKQLYSELEELCRVSSFSEVIDPNILSDGEFIDAIWPAVEDANSKAASLAQIGRETTIALPVTREYPQTDVGTVIRARVYKESAPEISAMYEKTGKLGRRHVEARNRGAQALASTCFQGKTEYASWEHRNRFLCWPEVIAFERGYGFSISIISSTNHQTTTTPL